MLFLYKSERKYWCFFISRCCFFYCYIFFFFDGILFASGLDQVSTNMPTSENNCACSDDIDPRDKFDKGFERYRVAQQSPDHNTRELKLKDARLYFEKSIAIFEKMNAVNELAAAQNNLAVVCYKLGENQLAQELYLKAIELNSTEPLFYNNIGWLYYKEGKTRIAKEKLNKSYKSNCSQSIFNLALISMIEGQYNKAEGFIETLLKTKNEANPVSSVIHNRSHFILGEIYRIKGNSSGAIKQYEKLLRPDGPVSSYDLYMKLGSVYFSQNNWDQAIKYFTLAFKIGQKERYKTRAFRWLCISTLRKKNEVCSDSNIQSEIKSVMEKLDYLYSPKKWEGFLIDCLACRIGDREIEKVLNNTIHKDCHENLASELQRCEVYSILAQREIVLGDKVMAERYFDMAVNSKNTAFLIEHSIAHTAIIGK